MKTKQQILGEIDQTIKQLTKNAATLQRISTDPHYAAETAALEKTQESLVAHLIHLEHYLKDKKSPPKRIKQKSRPRVRHSKTVSVN